MRNFSYGKLVMVRPIANDSLLLPTLAGDQPAYELQGVASRLEMGFPLDARIPSPFDWVLGEWRIDRTIPGHASMAGRAHVVLLPDGEATYRERVEVRLDSGKSWAGGCRYRYRRTEGGFDVLFEDTRRLFQSLNFRQDGSTLVAEAKHDCAMDRYCSEYVIRVDGSFTVRHRVHGPKKNYVSATEFHRT
jgi:hypothetical protein